MIWVKFRPLCLRVTTAAGSSDVLKSIFDLTPYGILLNRSFQTNAQLVKVYLVLPGNVLNVMEGFRGTPHAQQSEIHERLHELRIKV